MNIDPNVSTLNHTFGCRWGTFPIKYLGLPLHNKKLTVADWQFLVDKIEARLPSWQSQLLSIGGRVTLINSVLSSIPLYALSVYQIPLTVFFLSKNKDQSPYLLY